MTKEQTTYIKGIAILMMLFLHLFNHWNPGEYSAWLYIGDRPLVNIIARACSPVGIFLMLSGYGLHYVYVRNKLSLKGASKAPVEDLYTLLAHSPHFCQHRTLCK